jgi:outer membrane protein
MNSKYILSLVLGLMMAGSVTGQVKKWTLKECVDYAIENNISIQQAGIDIQDTELQKKSALGNFLPTANINSNHSWNIGLNQDVTTGVLVNQTTQNTSLGASVGVNIFNGMRNSNRMQRAELAMLASRYQLDDMKDNISLLVANSFLQILFNIESSKVLDSQYAVTEHDIKRTKELIESGILPPGDLLEIEATLASQEQQMVIAENNVRLTKISLAQLLLITDYKNFDVVAEQYDIPESEVIAASPHDIFLKAMETRNVVKISQANVELASKDLEIAKGGYYPTLSGFYSYNTRASNRDVVLGTELDPDFPTREIGVVPSSGEFVVAPNSRLVTGGAEPIFKQFNTNKGHQFGFQLTIPLFNGFTNKVNEERNVLNVQRAKLNLQQTKIDLESSVNQAYNDARGALKAYHAAQKTQVARQEAFNYAQERHDVGVINSFEYQQTQQLLESAESEVIRSKYDYIFKLKILEFYFGIPIAGTP